MKDFRPLLGFPDLRGSYSSDELFPLFAQRAMDPRRPDYQRYVERLGLEGEPGPWMQISRSQGRRQSRTCSSMTCSALCAARMCKFWSSMSTALTRHGICDCWSACRPLQRVISASSLASSGRR